MCRGGYFDKAVLTVGPLLFTVSLMITSFESALTVCVSASEREFIGVCG